METDLKVVASLETHLPIGVIVYLTIPHSLCLLFSPFILLLFIKIIVEMMISNLRRETTVGLFYQWD